MTAPDPAEALAEVLGEMSEASYCDTTEEATWVVAASCGAIADAVLAAIDAGQVPGVGRVEEAPAEALREAVRVGRRAALDPGAFVKRLRDREGDYERMDRWVDRALDAAADSLAAAPVPQQVDPEALAKAWDEGRRAGADMGLGISERIVGSRDDWPTVPANPYRSAVVSAAEPGGEVGTGAGEGATGQDTGTAWVTRSADCPEAPAQAHLPAACDDEPADQLEGR